MEQLLSTAREALYWQHQQVHVRGIALENIRQGDLCVFDIFADGDDLDADGNTIDRPITALPTIDGDTGLNYVRKKGLSAYSNYDATRSQAGLYCLPPVPDWSEQTIPGPAAGPPNGLGYDVIVREGEEANFILQGIGQVQCGNAVDQFRWCGPSLADFALVDRIITTAGTPQITICQSLQEIGANFQVGWCRFDGLYGFGTTQTPY